jgi:cytoskeletal protein RodZ
MARVNQGGSVLVFVVVAVIMAGLLVGGVYVVRQLTAQPTETLRPSQTAEEKPDTTQKEDQKPSENKDADKQANKPEAEEPAASENVAPPSGPADELPKTGPGSVLGSAFMLAILSAAAVSYARSRRVELSL